MTGKQLGAGEYDQGQSDAEKATHDKVSGSRLCIITKREDENNPHANIGASHHCGNEISKRVSLEIIDFLNSDAGKFFACILKHAVPPQLIGFLK